MNCWIILLLLCCCGKNNGIQTGNAGDGCECHEPCHNTCIEPRDFEKDTCSVRRERECGGEDYCHSHNTACSCSAEERGREKWMPHSGCNDNDPRDYHDSCRNDRACDCI